MTPDVLAWVERRVGRWGRHLRLQPADLDDARGNAVLAVLQALRHYDPARAADVPQSSFDAYLRIVVLRALWHDLRAARRLARHYSAPAGVNRLPGDEAGWGRGARPLVSVEEGPAEAAVRHEEGELLAAALSGLTPGEHRLYEFLLSGESLAGIARREGVTVKVVGRRFRRLWAKLSAAAGGRKGGARHPARKPP